MNQDLSWAGVGSMSTGGPGKVRDAVELQFGNPTRELLPAGMLLCK